MQLASGVEDKLQRQLEGLSRYTSRGRTVDCGVGVLAIRLCKHNRHLKRSVRREPVLHTKRFKTAGTKMFKDWLLRKSLSGGLLVVEHDWCIEVCPAQDGHFG